MDGSEYEGAVIEVALPLGTHTATLTVTDGKLSDTDEVVINVVDTTAPTLNVPEDVTVEQETADGTVTATDAAGNQSQASMVVTVVDTTPPVISWTD